MAIVLFALFAGVAGVETLHHAPSCGCFGTVRVPPAYTAMFDVLAVGFLARMPAAPPGLRRRSPWARPAIAAILLFASLTAMTTIELRARPLRAATVAAGRADAPADADFGPTGSLAVLEPGQWTGKPFALSAHIDGGSTLLHGRWVVLLVHDDCDHCAAAVPRFIADAATDHNSKATRLAIVEMPPFADASDPAPWFPLPALVVSGRLDASHDWFATTPVAMVVQDGVVTKAAEGDAAGDPAEFFPRIP